MTRSVPITVEQAQSWRNDDIAHYVNQIEALKMELELLKLSPLPTCKTEYLPLHPGDEGYDQAQYESFANFAGKWQFLKAETV